MNPDGSEPDPETLGVDIIPQPLEHLGPQLAHRERDAASSLDDGIGRRIGPGVGEIVFLGRLICLWG